MADPSPSVFLSHSSADKGVVERVGKFLTTHGVTVWIDSNELKAGTGIVRSLERVADFYSRLATFSVAASSTPKRVTLLYTRLERVEPAVHLDQQDSFNVMNFDKSCGSPLEAS
jgi:hypothetical protein